MLEVFVFPVSAVMKLWHWILADIFSLKNSTAWVVTIILLVVTVRSFIAPFTWALYKSGRMSMLMRPAKGAIDEKYAGEPTPEKAQAKMDETAALHKKYSYHPAAGCVPPLIQIPVLIGLYRLLMWLSKPQLNHSEGIGVLSADDIVSFRAAEFFGAPLPAYFTMPEDALSALGTTSAEVRGVIIPLLIFAIIFTTSNLWISVARGYSTLNWSSAMARGTLKFMLGMAIIMPFVILLLGLSGGLPVALLMYWVGNNLWTTAQTIIYWSTLVRRYPVDDTHRALSASERDAVREARATKLATTRDRRVRKARALRNPSTIGRVRRELADEKLAEREAKKEEKQRRKALNTQRSRARIEARKQARLKKKGQME